MSDDTEIALLEKFVLDYPELAASPIEIFPDRVTKLYNSEHIKPDSASMFVIEEVWNRLQK